MGRTHIVIGDTQVKAGVPTAHLEWVGQYIVDEFVGEDIEIIHVGDHWDFPALSSYDKGRKSAEGRRVRADVDAGNEGFRLLNKPLRAYNERQAKTKHAQWWPKRTLCLGNHEHRVERAVETDATLEGILSYDMLDFCGWDVVPFREIRVVDGVSYSHYFYSPGTGHAYSEEMLLTRLKKIGRTFTMGHQQGFNYCERVVGTRTQHGLVVGSTYLHDEKYLGPQVQNYWRGIAVCHQVEDGQYDLEKVSLDRLCRRYEGVTLTEFMKR